MKPLDRTVIVTDAENFGEKRDIESFYKKLAERDAEIGRENGLRGVDECINSIPLNVYERMIKWGAPFAAIRGFFRGRAGLEVSDVVSSINERIHIREQQGHSGDI
jgi:hypothetical protein